ncbi:MAG TPA: hypothetical protein VEG36_12175 [Burkholderiales bacterium]|nr:hypothetical protein [Burkholderiales bacterium]
MITGRELVDLGVVAAIGALVLWVVRPSGRKKKKDPVRQAHAGPAAWDPDTDAGRRKR